MRWLTLAVLVLFEGLILWLAPAAPPSATTPRPPLPSARAVDPGRGMRLSIVETPGPLPNPTPTPSRRERRQSYMKRLQRDVEALRGLTYKHDVICETRTRDELRDKLKTEMAHEDFSRDEAVLKALGLIPEDSNLRDLLLNLYTSQVAGFYDPATQRYYMVEDRPHGILGKLTNGISSAIDTLSDVDTIMRMHELDHALTDQYFHLQTYMHDSPEEKKRHASTQNDDEDLARQSVVEGDATMVMIHAQRRFQGLDFDFAPLSGDELQTTMDWVSWIPGLGQRDFNDAPLYLQRRMIFPYFQGAGFMDYLRFHQHRQGLDQAYLSPPRSSAQILHPWLYLNLPHEPLDCRDLKLPHDAAGWHLRASNVLGEFTLDVLFEQFLHEARDTAVGWRGDRFWVYTHAHERGLLLASAWASPLATRYAAQRFTGVLIKRHGFEIAPTMRQFWEDQNNGAWRVERDGRCYGVEFDGTTVRVVEGAPVALEKAWNNLHPTLKPVAPLKAAP